MVSNLRQISLLAGVFVLSLMAYACGGDGENGGMEPITTGNIAATVTADGSAKAGVIVQLFAPGAGSPTTAVATNSSGVANFTSVEEGTWELEVVVPQGFDLDQGEDERKSVTVAASQTVSASFALVDVFQGETVEANANLEFNPAALTIDAGTAVRWINVTPGSVLHTVTPDGHTEWTSADLPQNGSTFIHTFSTPGTYEYFCTPHVGQNMRGTITVN